MKSMCNSHGSSSLLFMIKKVMVWHFVSDSHKVMTTLNCCVTFRVLWRFLCNFIAIIIRTTNHLVYMHVPSCDSINTTRTLYFSDFASLCRIWQRVHQLERWHIVSYKQLSVAMAAHMGVFWMPCVLQYILLKIS